jgi:hypothetical protein
MSSSTVSSTPHPVLLGGSLLILNYRFYHKATFKASHLERGSAAIEEEELLRGSALGAQLASAVTSFSSRTSA